MWRSEYNFEELVVLVSVQVIRLAGGHLCLVNHPACLSHIFFPEKASLIDPGAY